MRSLDQTALAVTPKAPYVTWASAVNEAAESAADGWTTIYLFDGNPAPKDHDAAVRAWFREIFENELRAWTDDPERWPVRRGFAEFRAWFDVTVHQIVVDLDDDEAEGG